MLVFPEAPALINSQCTICVVTFTEAGKLYSHAVEEMAGSGAEFYWTEYYVEAQRTMETMLSRVIMSNMLQIN